MQSNEIYRELILAPHFPGIQGEPERLIGERIIAWVNSMPNAEEHEDPIVIVLLENTNTSIEIVEEMLIRTADGIPPSSILNPYLIDKGDRFIIAYNNFVRMQMESLDQAQAVLKHKGYRLAVMLEHETTKFGRFSLDLSLRELGNLDGSFLESCREGRFNNALSFFEQKAFVFALITITRDETTLQNLVNIQKLNPGVKAIFSQFGAHHRFLAVILARSFGSVNLHDPLDVIQNGQDKMLLKIITDFLIIENMSPKDFIANYKFDIEFSTRCMFEYLIYCSIFDVMPISSNEHDNIHNWITVQANRLTALLLPEGSNVESEGTKLLMSMSKDRVLDYLKERRLFNIEEYI